MNEGNVVNTGDEVDADIVSIDAVRKHRDWIDGDRAGFGVFFWWNIYSILQIIII